MSLRHDGTPAPARGVADAELPDAWRPLGLPGPLDLFGDDFVRDPYPWTDALRAEAPVHHELDIGLWLVSRHQDVRRVLLDPSAFLPDNAQHAVTRLPLAVLRVLARAGFTLPPALANNATATHSGLRRVVTRFFDAQ